MDLDGLRRELDDAAAAGAGARGHAARMRPARDVAARHCLEVLGVASSGQTIEAAIRLALQATDRAQRRSCAMVLVQALAVPGLMPSGCISDVCLLIEDALRSALLRCEYPFAGTPEQKLAVLDRLHTRIDELTQPMEPTFPNWQGLYAG
jgi:hypothetical protein